MACLYKRGRVWYVKWYVRGRAHYRSTKQRTRRRAEVVMQQWFHGDDDVDTPHSSPFLADLCSAYLHYAEAYYKGSSSRDMTVAALRALDCDKYRDMLVADFGPRALRTLMQAWAGRGLARKTVNHYAAVVKRMYRWAVSEELIPETTYRALCTVPQLARGRSPARETKPVSAVAQEHISAAQEHLTAPLRAMVDLQVLTGARAGEVCILRPCDIDQVGRLITLPDGREVRVWIATPQQHKGTWRDDSRELYVGPEAQEAIKPFLSRGKRRPLFDPHDSIAERASSAPAHRRLGQRPNPRASDRKVRDHYDTASYRRALRTACSAAGVAVFTPHQLRHTAATRIERELGLLAAQLILGHGRADVTQVYVERDRATAMEIAAKVG